MSKTTDEAIDVINEEIERTETLLDDLSEFTKGCTDAEQEILNKAAGIIQDFIVKLGRQKDND